MDLSSTRSAYCGPRPVTKSLKWPSLFKRLGIPALRTAQAQSLPTEISEPRPASRATWNLRKVASRPHVLVLLGRLAPLAWPPGSFFNILQSTGMLRNEPGCRPRFGDFRRQGLRLRSPYRNHLDRGILMTSHRHYPLLY